MKLENIFGNRYRGTLGKSMTVCLRNGKRYIREWKKPYDPKSPIQLHRRGRFKEAMDAWHALPKAEREEFNRRARRKRIYGVNLFVGEYMRANR